MSRIVDYCLGFNVRFSVCFQETREVFDSLLRHQHSVEAVKLLLRSSYKDLYMSAILLVYNEEEGVSSRMTFLLCMFLLLPVWMLFFS